MITGLFILAILVLIWVVTKIYHKVRLLRARITNLEHELHITRKRLYTLSKILNGGTQSYMDKLTLSKNKSPHHEETFRDDGEYYSSYNMEDE